MRTLKGQIFRPSALDKLFKEVLLEIDPQLSVAKTTTQQFQHLFNNYMLERYVFEQWKMKNNQMPEFKIIPDKALDDELMRMIWEADYNNELSFKFKE